MNKKILICGGTGCLSSKSKDIKENLEKELKERNINDVEVVLTGCFGFCEKGPIVKVVPANNFYIEVKPEDAKKIVEIDIIGDKKVERILYKDPVSQEAILDYKKMNFYQKQERRVLKNCGVIDPENIDDFLRNDGYKAAEKAISEMTKEFVIKNIIDSGLRGRGGGGFPTGIKWDIASKNHAEQKYIVCNADEGDPGAFMDRSILEGDPHSVIEGMMIAGYAIGATKGLVYIRAEYPLAISRLDKAIVSARKRGYLGKNLFGTDFEFDFFLPPIDDEGSAKLCTMVDQSFMVNPNSDCAEEAVEFLEYWVTDGALTWSETTMMPLITGESSDKLLPVVKSMAELKANSSISQGIFTKPFNTEFVNAWRKGLISYAESVCTGKPMTHEECLNNIQSLFDDIIATSK